MGGQCWSGEKKERERERERKEGRKEERKKERKEGRKKTNSNSDQRCKCSTRLPACHVPCVFVGMHACMYCQTVPSFEKAFVFASLSKSRYCSIFCWHNGTHTHTHTHVHVTKRLKAGVRAALRTKALACLSLAPRVPLAFFPFRAQDHSTKAHVKPTTSILRR